jgi:hypothetical protein
MGKPSALAVTAALAVGTVYCQWPVVWLGSITIGKCNSAGKTGIALRSRVWRAAFSKVRMPRLHSYERCPEFSNSRRDSWHGLRQGFEIVEEPPERQGADIWRERKRMLAGMHHLQTL